MKALLLEYWLPLLVITSLVVAVVIKVPDKKAFLKEYGLPLLIMTSLPLTFEGESWGWVLVGAAVVFLVGLVFRPHHVWIPWLGPVVVFWIYWAVLWLTGNWPWSDPTHGETLGSVALETVIFLAIPFLLPLITGKFLGVVAELSWAASRPWVSRRSWRASREGRP